MLSEQDVKAVIDMIGILTFYWADDYGAMLQAYALKRYIENNRKGSRNDSVRASAPVRKVLFSAGDSCSQE